jgi:hypothetical protein
LDGTLEFLYALPVAPGTPAAVRLVPILALGAVAAVAATAPTFLLLGLAVLAKGRSRAVPAGTWEQLRAALIAATIVVVFGAAARTFARFTPEARTG